jgi:hypothetical protein
MFPYHALSVILICAATVGCSKEATIPKVDENPATNTQATTGDKESEITATLAQLSDVDRRAAQAQKFCVVEQKNRLGSMGAPFKLMIEGQPVFLCCDGCKEEALKDPKATLAKVAELKQANSSSK